MKHLHIGIKTAISELEGKSMSKPFSLFNRKNAVSVWLFRSDPYPAMFVIAAMDGTPKSGLGIESIAVAGAATEFTNCTAGEDEVGFTAGLASSGSLRHVGKPPISRCKVWRGDSTSPRHTHYMVKANPVFI